MNTVQIGGLDGAKGFDFASRQNRVDLICT